MNPRLYPSPIIGEHRDRLIGPKTLLLTLVALGTIAGAKAAEDPAIAAAVNRLNVVPQTSPHRPTKESFGIINGGKKEPCIPSKDSVMYPSSEKNPLLSVSKSGDLITYNQQKNEIDVYCQLGPGYTDYVPSKSYNLASFRHGLKPGEKLTIQGRMGDTDGPAKLVVVDGKTGKSRVIGTVMDNGEVRKDSDQTQPAIRHTPLYSEKGTIFVWDEDTSRWVEETGDLLLPDDRPPTPKRVEISTPTPEPIIILQPTVTPIPSHDVQQTSNLITEKNINLGVVIEKQKYNESCEFGALRMAFDFIATKFPGSLKIPDAFPDAEEWAISLTKATNDPEKGFFVTDQSIPLLNTLKNTWQNDDPRLPGYSYGIHAPALEEVARKMGLDAKANKDNSVSEFNQRIIDALKQGHVVLAWESTDRNVDPAAIVDNRYPGEHVVVIDGVSFVNGKPVFSYKDPARNLLPGLKNEYTGSNVPNADKLGFQTLIVSGPQN